MIFTNSYVKWIRAGGRESNACEKMEKKEFDQRTKETQTSTRQNIRFEASGAMAKPHELSYISVYGSK